MRKISGIIIHCTATRPEWWAGKSTAAKVAEIRRWHVQERKWSDIGYHFLIARDGTAIKGRDMARDGAHTQGHNKGTIGIALFGGHGSAATDQFADNFTPEQDAALRNLIGDLRAAYGPLPVTGHNQYSAKACPGFNAPAWFGKAKPTAPPVVTKPRVSAIPSEVLSPKPVAASPAANPVINPVARMFLALAAMFGSPRT